MHGFDTRRLLARQEQATEDAAFAAAHTDHVQHLREALDDVNVASVTAATEFRGPLTCGIVVVDKPIPVEVRNYLHHLDEARRALQAAQRDLDAMLAARARARSTQA